MCSVANAHSVCARDLIGIASLIDRATAVSAAASDSDKRSWSFPHTHKCRPSSEGPYGLPHRNFHQHFRNVGDHTAPRMISETPLGDSCRRNRYGEDHHHVRTIGMELVLPPRTTNHTLNAQIKLTTRTTARDHMDSHTTL
jgi:hypothetical protein